MSNSREGIAVNMGEEDEQNEERAVKVFEEFLRNNEERLIAEVSDQNTNILHAFCAYNKDKEKLEKLVELFHRHNLLHSVNDEGKEPLHVAAEYGNVVALKALFLNLKNCNRLFEGRTAYSILICSEQKIDPADKEECLKCMLDKKMDINKPDFNGATPIYYAAKSRLKRLVEIILDNHKNLAVNLDSGAKGDKTARRLIEESELYDKYDKIHFKYTPNTFSQLYAHIEEKDIKNFEQLIDNLEKETVKSAINKTNGDSTLLQLACIKETKKIVEKLLECGADPNAVSDNNNLPPLHIVAAEYDKRGDETVGALMDIAQTLLQHGASLSSINPKNKVMAIDYLNRNTLKSHFDKSIKEKTKGKIVEFHFTSLLPAVINEIQSELDEHQCGITTEDPKNQGANLQETWNEDSNNNNKTKNLEVDVILQLSKSFNKRELILHPLITGFLYLKWHLLRWFFFTNVAISVGFSVSMFFYIFYNVYNVAFIWKYILLCFLVILTAKELLEMAVLRTNYLFRKVPAPKTIFDVDFQNLFDLTLLLLVYFVFFIDEVDKMVPFNADARKIIFIIIVLFTAYALLTSLEQLPYINCKIAMMKKVAVNIFKMFLLFAIVFVPFALCFNIMYKKQETDSGTSEGQFFFNNIFLAIFKTVVMMTGEYDMKDSLDFDTYPFASSILFFTFVFVVVLVCFNLLIGIAVSDIQAITKEAELLSLIAMTDDIHYVETLLAPFAIRKNFFVHPRIAVLDLDTSKLTSPTSTTEEKETTSTNNKNGSSSQEKECKGKRNGKSTDKLKECMTYLRSFFVFFDWWSLRLGSQMCKEVVAIIGETKRRDVKLRKRPVRKATNMKQAYSQWMREISQNESQV